MASRPRPDRGDPIVTAAMCAHERRLADPCLSPDGSVLAFVAVAVGGRPQITVVPAGGGAEVTLTSDPGPRGAHSFGGGVLAWTPDGRAIVFAGGDGNLWTAAADGGPPRPLTTQHTPTEPAEAPAVSPDGTRVAYTVGQQHVAVVDRDRTGWPRRIANGDFVLDPAWHPDGEMLAWHQWAIPDMPWDASVVMVASVGDGASRADPVVIGGARSQAQQPRWAATGELAFLCDAGGWLNLWTAMPGAPAALVTEPFEHGGPTWGAGQRSFAWSPDGSAIAYCRNEDGFGRLVVVDRTSGRQRELGKGLHAGLTWRGDRLAAVRSGARTPTQLVVYDVPSGERRTLAIGPVAGFGDVAVEPRAVRWASADGTEVHGRLYQPAPGRDRPPLLCWIHGGPTDQWTVAFRSRFAYWLARGWAILVPDHRGSTGHGRAYQQAMNGGWGVVDVEDCAAGLDAAAANGWGDPERLVVMGGSAGGFTVVHLLARHPGRCAAGVALYPVCDLVELTETTHRYEAHYTHQLVGPLPAAAGRYRAQSPQTVAAEIADPLLLLHGDSDPVVGVEQSARLAETIRRAGGDVEYHVYAGEGHGWSRPETVIDELDRTERFLDRVLRYRNAG